MKKRTIKGYILGEEGGRLAYTVFKTRKVAEWEVANSPFAGVQIIPVEIITYQPSHK